MYDGFFDTIILFFQQRIDAHLNVIIYKLDTKLE